MDTARRVATGRAGAGTTAISAIVVITILIVVAYLFYYLLTDWRYTQASSPWLIEGTRIARKGLRLPGSLIPLSNDGRYGIEFTYSMWIYVNQWETPNQMCGTKPTPSHILHKGSANISYPEFQGPGIWLDSSSNRIIVKMNTFGNLQEECIVDNIPIGKWVLLNVVVINKNIDIYINGRLKNRCTLTNVPMQNVGDLFITQNGGFDGFLSKAKYFNYAIPYYKIEQIFNQGPAQTPCTLTGTAPPPRYLASTYWLSGARGQEHVN